MGGCVWREKAGGLSWREEVSPPLLHPKAHPLPRVIKGVGLGVGVQPAFTSATPILRGIPLRCTGMGKLPRGC